MYIRSVAGDSGSSDEDLERAKDLLLSGAISQAEYDALRAKAIESLSRHNGGGVVSTGFCERPGGSELPSLRTLGAGRRYHYFVEISPESLAGSIETVAVRLPLLNRGAVLQVALFGFDGELQPAAGLDVGEMRLLAADDATVILQPGGKPGGPRLYLPVDTPATPGTHRLRCNIYYEHTLLQSRLIVARVTDTPEDVTEAALVSTVDFAVSDPFAPDDLEALQPRTLSILINDNGNGTHGFKYFGAEAFKRDVTLSGQALSQLLEQTRKGLRLASWASEDELSRWEVAQQAYRYATPSVGLLTEDLVVLARRGFKVWDVLVSPLAGGDDEALRALMRKPGSVEFANKQSLDLLVPAACLYDYPLSPEVEDLAVCPDFLVALRDGSLDALPCFSGDCPSYDDPLMVCPSGFWGFRHQIGYSASLTGCDDDDAHNFSVYVGGTPTVFIAGASTDDGLTERDAHLGRLAAIAGDNWKLALTRSQLFDLFAQASPSIVYLYGHGGSEGGSPYFEIGSGTDGPIIRSSLRGKAAWASTKPLVFLNGCHSAALSPTDAFSYATGFLQTAHASAVVGTEIAVFESLAVKFAEECLKRFVANREPLGLAVLHSRIALLQEGNPLALAYLAFGPIDVRLAGQAP